MTPFDLFNILWLPLGLGLFGFIEPCSIGASLLFIKYIENKDTSNKVIQVSIFALVRALFMGVLGLLAIWLGTAFLGLQKGAWIFFWDHLCAFWNYVCHRQIAGFAGITGTKPVAAIRAYRFRRSGYFIRF